MPSLFEQTRTLIQPTPFILHPSTPASLAHHRPPARVMHRLIDPIVLPLDLTFSLAHSLVSVWGMRLRCSILCVRAWVRQTHTRTREGALAKGRRERVRAPLFNLFKRKANPRRPTGTHFRGKRGCECRACARGCNTSYVTHGGIYRACNNYARLKTPVANGRKHTLSWDLEGMRRRARFPARFPRGLRDPFPTAPPGEY